MVGACLSAIFRAGSTLNRPIEAIVVNDASTDRTGEVAQAHGARVVDVENRQIAATRNAGAFAANGELLIFVDADTLVNAEVVSAAVREFERGAIGGGCRVEFDGPLPSYTRWLLPIFVRGYLATGWAAGCFMFCSREAFRSAGGFDERLYGSEEVSLSRALKRMGRFVVLDEAVLTSGRKFRMYTGREHLRAFVRLLIGGRASVRKRDKLSMWYDGKREDQGTDGG